jgi:hypothetical protein
MVRYGKILQNQRTTNGRPYEIDIFLLIHMIETTCATPADAQWASLRLDLLF